MRPDGSEQRCFTYVAVREQKAAGRVRAFAAHPGRGPRNDLSALQHPHGRATAGAARSGLVAGRGVAGVSAAGARSGPWLRLIGALLLLFLGAPTLRARPARHAASCERAGIASTSAATVGLTLSNPATILA